MIPKWTQLSAIGRSKIFRSSYFWIVFVPLVAKLTSTIPERIEIPWVETPIELNVSLPFSWTVFYFSAVFFALGSALYSIACPHIIKSYRNFAEFLEHGEGGKYLYNQSKQHLNARDPSGANLAMIIDSYLTSTYKEEDLIKFLDLNDIDYTQSDRSTSPFRLDYHPDDKLLMSIPQDRLGSVFSFFRGLNDDSKLPHRAACCILYIVGFALLAFVLLQNFIYVCSQFEWSRLLPE